MRSRLSFLVPVVVVVLLLGSSCFAFGRGMSKRQIDRARADWMAAYLKIQEASKAQEKEKLVFSLGLYEEALEQFQALQGKHPEWKPDVIAYRIEFCKGKIRTLEFAVEIDAEKMSRPDLVQEVKRLRHKREKHDLEIQGLNAQLETLRQRLDTAGKQMAKLQTDTMQLNALRTENRILQTRTGEFERKAAAAMKSASEATRKAAATTREKEALAVKISGLEGELSKSIATIAAMEKAEGVSSDVSKRLRVRLESLSAENKTLAAAVQSGASKIAASETALAAALSAKAGAKAEAATLQGRLASLTAENQTLTATVKLGADKLAASEEALAKAVAANSRLSEDLAAVREKGRKDFATLTGRAAELTMNLKTAEGTAKQVAPLTLALQKANARVQELTARETQREEALNTIRKTLSESEAKVKEMQRVVAFAEAADVDEMRKQLATNKTAAVSSSRKIETLKQQLLARTETEKRLIAERNKRLDEERAVQSRKRDREKKLHEYLKAGADAEKKKDARQALFSFKKVLEMEPENADAYAQVGLILAEIPGKDSEAERYLKHALELNPNHEDVIFRLGYVQIRQEKMAEAAATMMRGSTLNPKRASYRQYQGIAFRSLGWPVAAESAFKDAFKLDPKNVETAYNLAVLLATLDEPRTAEAKEWYQKSIELGGRPNKRFEEVLKAN